MLEYVLFAESLRNRFTTWLDDNGIDYRTAGGEEELLVLISEDLDEITQDSIDEQYEQLLEESASLADEQDDSPGAVHRVGIQFQRNDGTTGLVRISPELANRLSRCLDMVELQAFVQTIVDAVEIPDDRPLCKP
jgi:beta-phosphoglucomutase-like phosphatase (HAD superfamily)